MTEQERAWALLDQLFWMPKHIRCGLTTAFLRDYAMRHNLPSDALEKEAMRRVMYGQYKVFRRFGRQTVFKLNGHRLGRMTKEKRKQAL
ncbi:hypothetical protein [Flavonifractor sp. AGMB03687]|uniref:hypothetical protein n=1 Tax=Flavonifractor sp. AGMB03687 TaxID=2785133 RepID=UPI001AE0A730|nr:hypothetical protein [Flavonifractor sp. AGMB03687]